MTVLRRLRRLQGGLDRPTAAGSTLALVCMRSGPACVWSDAACVRSGWTRSAWVRMLALLACVVGLGACAATGATSVRDTGQVWDFVPSGCESPRKSSASDAAALGCRAPTLRVEAAEHAYNRIGTPELYVGWLNGLRARVDPSRPALFVEERDDVIAGRPVRQLVYRFHFEKIPLRFSRYFFEAHKNPGLMVVLTEDTATGKILFVSTVHTCGCYFAVVPTDAVDPAWLPEDWSDPQRLYGQLLPGVLRSDEVARGLRITLESYGHRVRAIQAGSSGEGADRQVELPLLPMQRLDELPIEGRDGESGSFFYTEGLLLRGKVRGAWNPMEGLTAFGWLSLDPTVGMDKRLGDPEQTGTRFYTLLPFWMHEESRLDRMDPLLRALGFRLPESSLQEARLPESR